MSLVDWDDEPRSLWMQEIASSLGAVAEAEFVDLCQKRVRALAGSPVLNEIFSDHNAGKPELWIRPEEWSEFGLCAVDWAEIPVFCTAFARSNLSGDFTTPEAVAEMAWLYGHLARLSGATPDAVAAVSALVATWNGTWEDLLVTAEAAAVAA